jgi:hypothetical protein
MDIKIEEKDDLYCVCVKIPPYNTRIKRKTIVNTSQVVREAKKLGYELGESVETSFLNNANDITEGTWTFKKKVLDKSEENVILDKEEIVQPKPKRTRRTRPATKKSTTEE